MTAAAPNFDAWRKKLLAKIHVGKKTLGLDDDAYRDLLEAATGRRSAKEMGVADLEQVVRAMRRCGFKDDFHSTRLALQAAAAQNAARETAQLSDQQRLHSAKIRALWLSLYHLGLVRNPSDAAIEAFVERQTKAAKGGVGIKKLTWLSPQESFRVIEALKDMAAKAGVNYTPGLDPRHAVLDAQAKKLVDLGAWAYDQRPAVASRMFCASDWRRLSADRLDALIQALGADIRKALAAPRETGGG